MIKALIVDDETQFRSDIKNKITTYFNNDIEVVGEADSVESGLKIMELLNPKLLFLDIYLSDGTGFDLLTKIDHYKFDVIFVTGYDHLALKAIKVGALDYILKPIDIEEFIIAVLKAVKNAKSENDISKLIEISSEYFKGVEKKRVILKTSDTMYAVYEDDILYCKSDGNYTTFYTQQLEKIVVSKSIKNVIEILSENIFVRCHQSYIVNKKHVLKYDKKRGLIIKTNTRIPVSTRRKEYTIRRIFE